jgi:hypothetical protein
MRSEFQEVTDSNATHLVIKDLRPYTYYLIYVQLYADRRARGASNTSWVRTFETSEFLRCFSDGTKQNKTKQNKTKQNKTRRELNRTIALPIISGARSGVQKVISFNFHHLDKQCAESYFDFDSTCFKSIRAKPIFLETLF